MSFRGVQRAWVCWRESDSRDRRGCTVTGARTGGVMRHRMLSQVLFKTSAYCTGLYAVSRFRSRGVWASGIEFDDPNRLAAVIVVSDYLPQMDSCPVHTQLLNSRHQSKHVSLSQDPIMTTLVPCKSPCPYPYPYPYIPHPTYSNTSPSPPQKKSGSTDV